MSWQEKLNNALNRLQRQGGAGSVEVQQGGTKAVLDVRDVDRLGCVLGGWEMHREAEPFPPPEAAKEQAQRLTRRLSYLTEPLDVVEWDSTSHRAQVRSRPPEQREGKVRYFDLEVAQGRSLRFRRLEYDPQARQRRPIPTTWTRDLLGRLLEDSDAILRGEE